MSVGSLNPIDHLKETWEKTKEGDIQGLILDPGNVFTPEIPEIEEAEEGMSDAELASIASEEAKRKGKKRKEVTQTVLTSPLGATGAETSTKTLGG